MSKLSELLRNGKILIPFLTCGDPDLASTAENIQALVVQGVQVLILGIPFSDPTAEGTAIQESNIRALQGGVTTDKIFAFLADLRKTVSIPILIQTYANVVFSYGMDRFAKCCQDVAVSGIIIPDVPLEERDEFDAAFKPLGVDLISMIAPTSEKRIARIGAAAVGFVYVVSGIGTAEKKTDIGEMMDEIRRYTSLPCAIGMGVNTPAIAAEMAKHAEGVIVDLAFTEICCKYGKEAASHIAETAKEFLAAMQ